MANYCKIPILNNEYCVVVFFGDANAARRLANRMGHATTNIDFDAGRGVCLATYGYYPLIVMPKCPRTPIEYGTLAHEACHAVEHVFQHIRQPIGDEVFAHSVGAVVREALSWGKGAKK